MHSKILVLLAAASAFAAWGETPVQGVLENVTRLTNDASAKYENPRFSPDGRQVAYTQLGYQGLYVMNADGSGARQLSDAGGVGYMYTWSADSKEILVRDTRWLGQEGSMTRAHAAVSISVADGTSVKLSDDAEEMQPAAWRYSADGAVSLAVPGAPIVATAQTLAVKQNPELAQAVLNPAYRVSYATDFDNLYLIDEMGNKLSIYEGPAFQPQLSPDGRYVAFVDMEDQIKVMPYNGGQVRTVTRGFNPVWLGNGSLVFERTTDNGHDFLSGDLMMVDLSTGQEKALTNTPDRVEMNPAISPDGKRIVFTNFRDGQVYIADIK